MLSSFLNASFKYWSGDLEFLQQKKKKKEKVKHIKIQAQLMLNEFMVTNLR